MTRLERDTYGYLFLVGLCLVLLLWAIPNYTPEYPGYGAPPDLVPIVAVCVMLFMLCLSLLRVVISRYFGKPVPAGEVDFPDETGESGFSQVGRVSLTHLARIILPCAVFLALIDRFGYIPISLIFLMALQFLIGSRRWLQSSVISIGLVATLYVVMRYGFGVPVPGPQWF
ncbi:MAG: hypothetical protein CL391_01995 [Acidiferrobacteraceae bacterium]|nr:hypothetical protein [Acidiferrobacteraceae bacterium]